MRQKQISANSVMLTSEPGLVLRRCGETTSPGNAAIVRADAVDRWEEVSPDVVETAQSSAEAEERYRRIVNERIRHRYDLDAELAILRQRDDKPEEFAAYSAYAEECKAEAKATINAQFTIHDAQSTDGSDVINAQCIMHSAQLSDISEVSEEGVGDE